MKRISIPSVPKRFFSSINLAPVISVLKAIKGKLRLKWFIIGFSVIFVLFIIFFCVVYFMLARPLLAIGEDLKKVKWSAGEVSRSFEGLDYKKTETSLGAFKSEFRVFRTSYDQRMKLPRKLPKVEAYYQDSLKMLEAADQAIELGELTLNILEPHATDLGFDTGSGITTNLVAEDRIIKLLSLMPQFSPRVKEISERVAKIDKELSQIDAKHYPISLPSYVKYFGIDPETNIRDQVLAVQSVSHELSLKAPQFEALFNALPDFLGLNEPKKYMILMANNYELRMAGGFNTYVVIMEFNKGKPEVTYSIDTYFIDEGDRTGSSFLVNRNVPYFLSKYLYIQERGARLYARDATSISADFPIAAENLMTGFWKKDRSLPQAVNGVIQVNNDVAVDLLRVVGPVNTDKFSVRTDTGAYKTIPFTEFNSDNVIQNLEDISGGKLAQTTGRKDIIQYLAESIKDKIYGSSATNIVDIAKVILDSLGKKDIMVYSYDPLVQQAFENLGYAGRIRPTPEGWDYLHVNRSNFGSGKADWTKEGFVTTEVNKNIEVRDGKKVSTVEVKIKNPKRPGGFNIDPCCFYNAYLRVFTPAGSKLVSVESSDGQDAHGAECGDVTLDKSCFESYTKQLKETEITVKFTYELPDTVNIDDYNIFIQRQSGTTPDPYTVGVNGVSSKVLLNADTELSL